MYHLSATTKKSTTPSTGDRTPSRIHAPTRQKTKARYIGLRVKRNGPVVTSLSASLNGRMFVFALMNSLIPIAPVARPMKIGNRPSQHQGLGNRTVIGHSQRSNVITPRHIRKRTGGINRRMVVRPGSIQLERLYSACSTYPQ